MGDTDLLSLPKKWLAVLQSEQTVFDKQGVKIVLPKGTRLNYVSGYNEVDELSLHIVITDPSLLEYSDGSAIYFNEEKTPQSHP